MKKIEASQFKEKCLSILENIDKEGIIITKNRKPVAKLLPIATQSSALIGALEGKLSIKGDIFTTGKKWNAES